MVNKETNSTRIILSILIFALVLIYSCATDKSKEVIKNDPLTKEDSLRQDKDLLLGGVIKAVSYSGFRTGQHPDRGDGAINPTKEEILEDLTILSQNSLFQLIRLYDCGINSQMVLESIRENNIDIKVMLGAWLEAEVSNHEGCFWMHDSIPTAVLNNNKLKNKAELDKAIELSNEYPDIIISVNVGNEALVGWTDHLIPVQTVIGYVTKVKESISQKVTVAENCDWWAQDGEDLAEVVDFLAIHSYPVWSGKGIEEGMSITIEDVYKVRKAFPDKMIVISEAGWATIASEFGDRASEDNQVIYYEALMDWATEMNITTFFFEAFDEDWKGDPGNMMGAEKHWGLFNVDRTPKKAISKYYAE